jgi:hypothetical protein
VTSGQRFDTVVHDPVVVKLPGGPAPAQTSQNSNFNTQSVARTLDKRPRSRNQASPDPNTNRRERSSIELRLGLRVLIKWSVLPMEGLRACRYSLSSNRTNEETSRIGANAAWCR